MFDFKYYLNNDWFKVGRFGEKHVKNINIGLLVCGSIILFSIIFYTILYSSTNFHALDDLEDYVQEYDAQENLEFDRINLAMKIMPSYNTEKNALYMEHSRDIYKSKIPESIEIMENLNMNNTFFFINKTELFFPKLLYKQENIPVGNSITMCIAVSWAPIERGNNYDIMKPVIGFPRCKESESGKFIWNSEDPLYGIDVPVWVQRSIDIDCTDTDDCDRYCEAYNAEFVKGKNSKKCYYYDILDAICIAIEYNPDSDEYVYAGGCYKNNLHYIMVPAEQNKIYYFGGIEIEVRNKKDPIIKAGEMSNFSFSFGEKWNIVSIFLNIFLFFSLVGLAVIVYYIIYYKKKYNVGKTLLPGQSGLNNTGMNDPSVSQNKEGINL